MSTYHASVCAPIHIAMHACTYAPFYQQFSSAFFLDFKTFLMEIILFVFLIFPHFLHENKRLRFPKAEGSYKSKKASSYRPVRRFQVPFVLACTNISLNSFYKSVNVLDLHAFTAWWINVQSYFSSLFSPSLNHHQLIGLSFHYDFLMVSRKWANINCLTNTFILNSLFQC